MIDVKTAVSHAFAFLGEMYKDEEILDPRLEEVDLSDDGAKWHITLSYLRKALPRTGVHAKFSELGVLPAEYERQYKVLAVGAETGEVRSMKIRTLA